MTAMEKKNKFLQEVRDYKYRHEYVSANIVNGLAFQIGLMRDAQEWTQDELANRCGETVESISRLEDPNDDGYTCLLYTSPSPRDRTRSRMPSSA